MLKNEPRYLPTGLDLDLLEAEEFVDLDAIADESADGIVYRYIYDFSQVLQIIATKLMARYGSLQVEVPSWFFDRVHSTEY